MILLVLVFITFLTIDNYIKKNAKPNILDLEGELNIEKQYVLDYIAKQNLDDFSSEEILENFSKSFIQKIGKNKNILFLIAKDSSGKIIGNLQGDCEIYYWENSEKKEINSTGDIEINVATDNTFTFEIDQIKYNFEIFEGQNIYYLIKQIYNGEEYIIYG
jgi:hypothetical protein